MSAILSILRRITCPLILMQMVLFCGSAHAAEPEVRTLQLGFAGQGRVGAWLPVRLVADHAEPAQTLQLQIVSLDPRGDLCESVIAESTADASGNIEFSGVFSAGRLDGRLQIRLLDERMDTVWSREIQCREAETSTAIAQFDTDFFATNSVQSTLQLARHTPTTILLASPLAGIDLLQERLRDTDATREVLSVLSCHGTVGFPETPRALDGIDHVVLTDDFSLSVRQAQALQSWVLQGGHLIISCGAPAEQFLSSPVGQWLQPVFEIPAAAPTTTTLDLTPIQNFVLGATALQTNRTPVTVMQIPSRQPRVLARTLTSPLLSGASIGAGTVTMLAVDLNQRPLNSWLSLPQFLEILIFRRPLSGESEFTGSNNRISSVGVSDLSTQLLAAADLEGDESRWSAWDIMLIMLVVLLLIGPLDYLLVVRTLQKPRLTWLTFPLAVAAACFTIVRLSSSDQEQARVHSIGLLDITSHAGVQQLRARTWSSLTSRETQYAAIAATSPEWLSKTREPARSVLSWSGRAEDVYGGMYRPGGAGLGQQTSRRSELEAGRFEAMPLVTNGASGFSNETSTQAPADTWFTSDLELASSDLLEGTLTHHLPFPVRDWIVVCGNRVYTSSDLATDSDRVLNPGEVWSRKNDNIRVYEIRSFLRGVRIKKRDPGTPEDLLESNKIQISSPWDLRSRDALDILLMTSLYKSAGGTDFVKLRNDTLRRDEVSEMINLNGAMLIGRVDEPLSALQLNETPVPTRTSQTVARLLLPVRRSLVDRDQQAATSE
ncbi:MAG: hypothetical protein ACO3FE_07660 [Planctomycetaceae bacterium]